MPGPKETPRGYQEEILVRAKTENVIAFLETGSGKTLVSALLVQHVLESPSTGDRIAVFIVDKVALVHQQAEYMRDICEYNVGTYFGDMGLEGWSGERWLEEFAQKKILVLTAQIFLNALRHGLIRMTSVALICFDEVHHATRQHPFRRIMVDFYHTLADVAMRPRVFGMTASPVKVKAGTKSLKDCGEAIAMLEITMDATVVGVSDTAQGELEALVPSAAEFVAEYTYEGDDGVDPQQTEDDLAVNSGLDALVPSLTYQGAVTDRSKFKGTLMKSRAVLAKGSATDMDILLRKVHVALGNHVAMFLSQELSVTSSSEKYGGLSSRGHLTEGPIISDRVKVLLDLLVDERKRWGYENPGKETGFRCIVFVHQRLFAFAVSWVINAILGELKTNCFESRAVVGCHAKSSHLRMSQTQQNEVLNDFRRGVFGVLVATNVVEEGLDIPACSLVIAFDAVQSAKAYIQARGRARSPGSHYVALIPRNSATHAEYMAQAYHGSLLMKETVRALNSKSENAENWRAELALEAKKALDDTLTDVLVSKTTPARVLPDAALTLVNKYCVGLVDCRPKLEPEYKIKKTENGYFCYIRIPSPSPVRTSNCGIEQSSMQLAKRLAALNAYKALYEAGEVDEFLLPKLRVAKKVPGDVRRYRGTKGPKIAQKVRQCPVVHPSPLKRARVNIDDDAGGAWYPVVQLMHVYMVNIEKLPPDTSDAEKWGDPTRHGLILESKVRDDDLTAFLCPTGDPLLSLEYLGEMEWTKEKEQQIRQYMHITEGCVKGHFPRWLSDLETDVEMDEDATTDSLNDLDDDDDDGDGSKHDSEGECDPIELGSVEDKDEAEGNGDFRMKYLKRLKQKIVEDLKRKDLIPGFFFAPLLNRTASGAGAGEKVDVIDWNAVSRLVDFRITGEPSAVPVSDWSYSFVVSNHEKNDRVYFVSGVLQGVNLKSRPNGYVSFRFENIEEYYLKRHGVDLSGETDDLLEGYSTAEYIGGNRKRIFPLCRATCFHVPLSPWAVYTASLLPSWQTFVTLKESWRKVCAGNSLKLLSFVRAVQPNMGSLPRINPELNYERNEFLGDAVLKLVSSLMAYANAPAGNEGLLTDHRDDEIANDNLCNIAVEYGVPNCIAYTGITRKAKKWQWFWGIPQVITQPFSEKVLADCIEAMIGAHFLEGGLPSSMRFMDRIGVVKGAEDILKLPAYKYVPMSEAESNLQKMRIRDERIRKVERTLGYKFKCKELVLEALTHGSFAGGKARSYQRLEFLGDAAIGFALLARLFREHPSLDPGDLSALREPILSNDVFARVVVGAGLHGLIWMDCIALDREINKFVLSLKTEKHGEDVCKQQTVPKVLGDVFESLIGAVVVDQGMRLDGIEDIVVKLMRPLLAKYANPEKIIEHPVSKIGQIVQAATGTEADFSYEDVAEKEEHAGGGINISRGMIRRHGQTETTVRCFVCVDGKEIGRGTGPTKRAAKHSAALNALTTFKAEVIRGSSAPGYDI